MKMMKDNVLFLLVDALRADKCWGNRKTAKTPTIDSLCKKGVVFTRAIAATSVTTSSVASILTGMYPLSHGIRSLTGYKLSPSVRTLAEIFRDNGYNTYAKVTGPLLPETGLNRGFDEYNYREKVHHAYSRWGISLIEKFGNKEFKEPWFVFIHFWGLHVPRIVPNQFDNHNFGRNRYERALSALDAYLKRLLDNIGNDVVTVLLADHGEKIFETKMEEELSLKVKQRVWKVMRKVGLKRDNTLQAIGHGFHVYDYLIRVPLVFVGDGVFPEGKIVRDQVSQVDVLPTLIEALKIDVHSELEIDGRSLLPLVKGQRMQEVPVFIEACGKTFDRSRYLAGVRTPKFKFVYGPYNEKIQEELYDLKNDPDEKQNILRKKPQIALKLKKILKSKYKQISEKKLIPYTPEEEEKIKEKLRRLGYL